MAINAPSLITASWVSNVMVVMGIAPAFSLMLSLPRLTAAANQDYAFRTAPHWADGKAGAIPMTTITFDTQELVVELENSGFTRQQSEAVVSVLKKSQSELATKDDLHREIESLRNATKTDLLELKVDLVKWVGALMLAQVAVIAALVKLL